MTREPPAHRRRRTFRFVRTFLASPRTVGAILPSSRDLARAMVRGVRLQEGEVLVELGPGTGALTGHIRRILPDPSRYLGIEREARFVEILEERFPDLRFVRGDAADAAELLDQAGLGSPRVILSGLPFASLRREDQERILGGIARVLPEDGIFRTFQYLHGYILPAALRFRRRTNELLGCNVHVSPPLFANLPPAYVLTWERQPETP